MKSCSNIAMPRFSCIKTCFRRPGRDNELREAREAAPQSESVSESVAPRAFTVPGEKSVSSPALSTLRDANVTQSLDGPRELDAPSLPVQHECTAEDFIEEEIKDLCATITHAASKLESEPQLTPAERSALKEDMADSTARLKVMPAGSISPHRHRAHASHCSRWCRPCTPASAHRTRRR